MVDNGGGAPLRGTPAVNLSRARVLTLRAGVQRGADPWGRGAVGKAVALWMREIFLRFAVAPAHDRDKLRSFRGAFCTSAARPGQGQKNFTDRMKTDRMYWLNKTLPLAAAAPFLLSCLYPFVATSYESGIEGVPERIDGFLNGFECLGVHFGFCLAFLFFAVSVATLQARWPGWSVLFSLLALSSGTTVFSFPGQTFNLLPGDPRYLLGSVQAGAFFWFATLGLPAVLAIWKRCYVRSLEKAPASLS